MAPSRRWKASPWTVSLDLHNYLPLNLLLSNTCLCFGGNGWCCSCTCDIPRRFRRLLARRAACHSPVPWQGRRSEAFWSLSGTCQGMQGYRLISGLFGTLSAAPRVPNLPAYWRLRAEHRPVLLGFLCPFSRLLRRCGRSISATHLHCIATLLQASGQHG